MNPNWTDVKDIWDILDHVWIGLVVISAAIVPSWLVARNHSKIQGVADQVTDNHSKIQGVADQVTGVAAQVVNGHTTPFREDVDGIRSILDEMRGDMHLMKSDVSDIRSQLRQERKDRIDLDDRFERYKRDQ